MDFIFLQDQDERTIGHLSNEAPNACPYYKDLWKRDRDTGASTYEFHVPADHPGAGKIQKEGYIVRANFRGDLMQFQITRIEEVHDGGILSKFVYCEYAWAELNGEIVRPYDLPQVSAYDALNYALAGTRYKPGKVEYAGHQDLSSSAYDTSLKMAHDIKDAFDGEIQFRVTMKDGKITGRFVDLVERVGRDRGKVIAFERNLENVKRIYDRSSVATALIGIGKGDSDGQAITFTTQVWRTADGKPVDKPAGQDWIGDPAALKQYGIQGRHITQVFEYNTTSPSILLSKTWEELKRRKNGLMQYEAGAAVLDRQGFDWEASDIGDDVLIQDLFFEPPLMVDARIIQLEQSFTDPDAQSATFGDYEPALSDAGALAEIQRTLMQHETQWSEQPQGMATVIRSNTAPAETENVIWVQPATGTRPFDIFYTWDQAAGKWAVSVPLNAAQLGAQDAIYMGPTPPPNPTHNQVWGDTSTTPNLLKRYDAPTAGWIAYAPTNAAQIGAEAAIIKANTAPPHLEGRLWMDTSKVPNVTYRSSGGAWVKTVPTTPAEVGAEAAIFKQATAPAHLLNRIWIDTSKTPNQQYRSTGSTWVNITPTKPGDVGADAAGAAAAARQAAIDAAALDATSKANAAQLAAENLARSEAAAAQTDAEAYADGKVTAEEQARINQAAANLATAKQDATDKATAAETAAKTHADLEAADAQAAAEARAVNEAKIAEYRAYLAAMLELMEGIARRAQPIIDNGVYYMPDVYNSINFGITDLWSRYYDVENAINGAAADGIITTAEESDISTWKGYFEAAMRQLNFDLTVASQDAGGLLLGKITGITVQVANAGLSADGTLASSVRLWAGQSYANRASAPFRVLHDGRVVASNISIIGGSINIATDATVGRNLYLGATGDTSEKRLYFNSSTYLAGSDYALTMKAGRLDLSDPYNAGISTDGGALYLDGNIVEILPEVYASSAVNVSGALRVNGTGMSLNDIGGAGTSTWITPGSAGQFMTNHTEQGFCGLQVESNGTTYNIGVGVGVNYKVNKSYTPSSVSITRQSGNLANSGLYVGYIDTRGFWIQITRAASGSNTAWRGLYTC